MAYDTNNIFAKILRGEVPSVKVYEDDKTLAFMDVMPQADGHTLVVPKEPAENIFELSPEGAAAMVRTTQKVAKAVKKGLDAPGIMFVSSPTKSVNSRVTGVCSAPRMVRAICTARLSEQERKRLPVNLPPKPMQPLI